MTNSTETAKSAPLVVLFDDERSFLPGIREGATVLRTSEEAISYFEELKSSGTRISELWLDFVLKRGDVTTALLGIDGGLVDTVYYHSNAIGGADLLQRILEANGFTGEFLIPERRLFSGSTRSSGAKRNS